MARQRLKDKQKRKRVAQANGEYVYSR
jgi:hypothetical protein